MNVLRTTDETHAGHAKTVVIHYFAGRIDQAWVIGESQVVVGTKVDDFSAAIHLNMRGRKLTMMRSFL